jgi:alpha-beta hydrolase superfamily lysophospholipase
VLFLDQRGTGLSSTITAGTLARQGDAIKQAEYLKNFRADDIVRDCEAIRNVLTKDYPSDQRRWSILGQSFGGFCAVTYLSKLYVLDPFDFQFQILSCPLILSFSTSARMV